MGKTINDYDLNAIIRDPEGYAKRLSVRDLEELILILKDHYYNEEPLVPDLIYDQLEDVLRKRSPKSSVLSTGAPVHGTKVELPYPMASQNKAKMGAGTIDSWLSRYRGPYLVSHKIDGISLMVHRSGGARRVKEQLYTRGNGEKGTNVTQLLEWIDMGERQGMPTTGELAVRGELIIPKAVWDRKYAADYPNVRNFVAGLVNSSAKNPEESKLRDIQFVAYQVVVPKMPSGEQFRSMVNWGFHVAPHSYEKMLSDSILDSMLDTARRTGPYQIDGLVVTDDSKGYEAPDLENPKSSIAYKNQTDEVAQTQVIEVLWKGSKKARIKPTVVIEPVFLSGGNLSRATAHYAKFVVDNKIGPGALVTIVRSGDVIPYIVSVDRPANGAQMPDFEYKWTANGLDIYVVEDTDEIVESRMVYLAKALEIDHLGPGTVKKLVGLGFRTVSGFLRLELADLERAGLGKMAEKIWASWTHRMFESGVKLAQLMDATSVFQVGIGRKKLQLVLNNMDLISEFESIEVGDEAAEEMLIEKMVEIKGIEWKTARAILDGLPDFVEILDSIDGYIKIREFQPDGGDGSGDSSSAAGSAGQYPKLDGLRVIFTGVRDKELEALIEANGGTVASGISKTHGSGQVLVAKDPTATSNKIKTARELGVPVMTLDEFKTVYLN